MSKHSHDHSHEGHSHGHDHHHHHRVTDDNLRSLKFVMALTTLFMVVEFVGAYVTGSLALFGDAAHMLSDIGALGFALFAATMAKRPANPQKTFGYHRLEILAAFTNGLVLVGISFGIFWEALERFKNPTPIKSFEMLVIASSGLFVNLFGAWLLHRHKTSNVNMRGALFHLMGDALGSVGVIIAAICVQLWGWTNADPVVSIFISVIIVISAMRLIFDTAHLIMEGAPTEIDTSAVEKALRAVPMVKDIHDLHIWSITSGMPSLSVHVVCEESDDCHHHDLLVKIKTMLVDKFHIDHVTIQLEDESLRESEPEV